MPYPSPSLYPSLTIYPGPVALPANGRPLEHWLACGLYFADGRVHRFGPDERDEADIPYSISWETQNPGGYGTGSIVLPRPPNLRADDAALFSHAVLYGPHGTAYEGRVTGIPQVGANEVRLELEGWSAHLDDDETFLPFFVDRDLSHWQAPPAQRDIVLLSGSPRYVSSQGSVEAIVDSTNGSALRLSIGELTQPVAGNPRALAESWYVAETPIGYIYYSVQAASLGGVGAGWNVQAFLTTDEAGTVSQAGTNFATADGAEYLTATTPDRKHAGVQMFYTGTYDGAFDWVSYWRNIAVYGTHGLTRRGPDPGGFYGSDILAYTVSTCAPLLNYTLGDSIEQSAVIVPHYAPQDRGTARRVVEEVTALSPGSFEGQAIPNDWGVYENREFFHRSPGTYGKTWRVRKDQVASLTAAGPDSKRRIGGMMITYSDGAGKTHTVGPPGSGAEYETTDLLDNDSSNPATKLGRKWQHRQVGITNQEGALNIGRMLLAEGNRVDWTGQVSVRGEATDSAGNRYPTDRVKAGDQIVVEDEEGLWEPRAIASTSHNHDDLEVTVSVGAPPESGEVLLAQLVAATDLVPG